MIELNLTYEESKKILELGYDFSKICINWSTEHTKYIKVGSKLIEPRLVEELELAHNQELHPNNFLWNYSLEFSEVESKIQDFINPWAIDWITYYPPISIIPKGILEKCLPKIPFLKTNNQFDFHYTWKKPDFDSDAVELYTRITHIEIPEKTEKEFQSAYEAFLWCHENYPKELKKKFEEVMG